jgi:hypothetical protein
MATGRKTGGGSRKDIPNKATADARKAIAAFVDGNADRLQGWLDQVANGRQDEETGEWLVLPNPVKAYELFQSVIEYHVPKLGRQEVTGANGDAIQHAMSIAVSFVNADKR